MKSLLLIIAITTFSLMDNSDLYKIKINSLQGKALDLSAFRGKKLLIVNVASECGYTPQYQQLEALNKLYQGKLAILGCPSNDFGGQEPGSAEEIQSFCSKNFGVTFTLTEKIGITKQTHELYSWLTQKSQNGVGDFEVKWNFTKFLINEDGSLYKCLPSAVEPLDEQITEWVNK